MDGASRHQTIYLLKIFRFWMNTEFIKTSKKQAIVCPWDSPLLIDPAN